MTTRRSRFLPDTSCVVAAVCGWHERHEEAAGEIQRRLDRGDVMLVAGQVLVEAYSVLTRLPAPHRLSAEAAGTVLDGMADAGTVTTLDGAELRSFLSRCVQNGITGGQTHDAVIATCATAARADVLLTFNARHFPQVLAVDLRVVVPGERTA